MNEAVHTDPRARVAALPFWSGKVDPQPLKGGITNTNFLVEDQGTRFVVRIGADIPVHGIMRFNELAAAKAAVAAGLSPDVVYSAPGVLVMRHVAGRTLEPSDVREPAMLARIVPLIQRCHREMPRHLHGPVLIFWVFHVIRTYAHAIRTGAARRENLDRLADLMAAAEDLEARVGPIDIVFGHNDLLAANFIDAGDRLWLIDWDYAGFNSPLFDLGGLASNNELDDAAERRLLESYFERPADADLFRRYLAMKCASLLREAMWSMVSEIHSTLAFDYVAYTEENLARFTRAYAGLRGA